VGKFAVPAFPRGALGRCSEPLHVANPPQTSAKLLNSSTRKRSKAVLVLLAAILQVSAATADISRPVGVTGSFGYRNAGQPGVGLNVSAYVRAWVFALHMTADLTAEVGDSKDFDSWTSDSGAASNYSSETFSNGQTACRDLSTGQFTEKHKCGGGLDLPLAYMGELHLSPLAIPVFVGAGLRTSPAPGPFAVVGYLNQSAAVFQYWFVRSALGRNFVQIHAGISF
jgi:hypothetical protein